MYLFKITLFMLFMVGCYAVPSGYILKVDYSCGALTGGSTNGAGANVTIISDLHANARLTCSDGYGLPITVKMPQINDTNTRVTTYLYYTGDSTGTAGTDCFFFHPSVGSNVYVVKLELYWGFNNATLMEDYETYTLTCTTDGDGSQNLAAKNIDDSRILMTGGYVHNLGTEYRGSSSLRLMDVKNNEITGTKIPMGKKVYLELSISDGSEGGLTPYDCYAQNSGGSKTYKIFNAGCGDGIIFHKRAGFEVKGTKAISPYFKVFKLIEATGNTAAVKYRCSFTTCNNTCDGSSCTLLTRKKRSLDEDTSVGMVYSSEYDFKSNQHREENDNKGIANECSSFTIALISVAVLSLMSLLITLYTYMKQQRVAHVMESSWQCRPKCHIWDTQDDPYLVCSRRI